MKWLILLGLVGCAQVTSLNLKKHQFGLIPTKIIWFQVAGLEEEQISMIRFNQLSDKRTAFEESICVGQTWGFNLYKLRNTAQSTFFSQITGKKNVKNTCDDAELRPIWNYINPNGYNTGVLESGANMNESLTSINTCGEQGSVFLSSLYFFKRSQPAANAATFHYSDEIEMTPNQILYDRTCGENSCASSLTEDLNSIYRKFSKVSQKHLMIVRDFSYLHALEKKEFSKAREILNDIDRAYSEALKLTNSSDYLVLLTTGDSRFIDMPDQGKSFYDYDKSDKNINVKRTKLTNLVLASGARAENFCGMYDDSEVLARILSGPKQQGLEFKIINPFK
jgi:hypothetical protein